jgi:ABC-type sugar transport system substrate-binding protein
VNFTRLAMRITSGIAVMCLALGACSTSGSGGGSGTTGSSSAPSSSNVATSSSSAAADSGVQTAKAFAAASLRTDVKLTIPTTPVKLGHHKLAIINIGENSPYGVAIKPYFNAAAKATGWQYTQFDAQLSFSNVAGYVEQAIQQKYDGIILTAVDPSDISAPVQAALNAGIPIVCMSCQDIANTRWAGKIIDVRGGWNAEGQEVAAAIVAARGTAAKPTRFTEPAYPSVVAVTESFVYWIKKYCPACSAVPVENQAVQELTQPGPPSWTAFLDTHPAGSFTDIVAPYDYSAQVMQATANQAGRSDVIISDTSAQATQINAIRTGADKGWATVEPQEYQAWAAVDLIARALDKQPLWNAANEFSPLVDAANAAKFLPLGNYNPDGQDYIAEFEALWQK